MARTPEEWARTYEEHRPLCSEFTAKLHQLLGELLHSREVDVAQIEQRTKTVESFKEKLQREGKSYDDPLRQVTDLCGVRIIAYYPEDVDEIGKIVRQEFEVDERNSVNKAQATDPDRFGYLSVHHIVMLSRKRERLAEWKPYVGLKAEVQVRTVLQHAWAVIDHKLRYKAPQEVPRTLKRQLFRLSALLELADSEFSDLRVRSERLAQKYSEEVRRGEYDIELDLESLDAYIESSRKHLKWAKIASEVGFRSHVYEGLESEVSARRGLLTTLKSSGISRIREFHDLLLGADEWGKEVLSRIRVASQKRDFIPYAVPHDVLSILVIFGRRKSVTMSVQELSKVDTNTWMDELAEGIAEVAELGSGVESEP